MDMVSITAFEEDVTRAIESVKGGSVVSIYSSRVSRNPPFVPPARQESAGSGIIVRPDGLILTNNHVVANSSELSVVTDSGDEFQAEILGTDPPTDLAVLSVPAMGLPAARLGGL